jgi:hypothetical protein
METLTPADVPTHLPQDPVGKTMEVKVEEVPAAEHVEIKAEMEPVEPKAEVAPVEQKTAVEPKKRRNGERGYYRNEELGGPIHEERQMRILVCGAGASALCFAYKLQRSFENFSLTLFEKNPDISGTWYENRYPG